MKRIVIISALLIVSVLCGCESGEERGNSSSQASQSVSDTSIVADAKSYRQISQSEAMDIMKNQSGYIILDVRMYDEYSEGHIPDAICVPNETITTKDVPQLPDKSQMILVYCRSGRRSKEAAQKLADLGYTKVLEFGGINDWTGKVVTGLQEHE